MANKRPTRIEKVLRIGIIKDRQVLNERLILPGEVVSIGSSAQSTFSVDIPGLPKDHVLFKPDKSGAYTLQFTEKMGGRVAKGRDILGTLEELRTSGKAPSKGGVWNLKLQNSFRGKVEIGDFSFLFQFIPAPPISTRPKYNYNPKYVDEDDVVFFAFLGLFSMMSIVFLIYAMNIDPPPIVSQEDIQKRFVHLLEPPTIEEEPPPELEDESELKIDAPEEKTKEKEEPEPEPEPEVDQKKKNEAKAEKISKMSKKDLEEASEAVEKTAFFQLLGARVENSGGNSISETLGKESQQDLDKLLSNVTSGEVASAGANLDLRKQSDKGGRGNSDIGVKSAKKGVKSSGMGKGPATKGPSGSMKMESIQTAFGECSKDIRRVVRKKKAQVKYCYESRLKDDPTISGRVVVGVSIGLDGKVFSARIKTNTTKDKALEKCIVRKVKRWKFPKDCEEEANFPFALQPGN